MKRNIKTILLSISLLLVFTIYLFVQNNKLFINNDNISEKENNNINEEKIDKQISNNNIETIIPDETTQTKVVKVIVKDNDSIKDNTIIDEVFIDTDNNELVDNYNIDNNTIVTNNDTSDYTDNKTIDNEKSVLLKKIIIIDESKGDCAQAIEYFYEDSNYKYYFNCIKSHDMYVLINGEKYNLAYALNNKIVSMSDLNNAGYNFLKKNKNNYDK